MLFRLAWRVLSKQQRISKAAKPKTLPEAEFCVFGGFAQACEVTCSGDDVVDRMSFCRCEHQKVLLNFGFSSSANPAGQSVPEFELELVRQLTHISHKYS